MSTSVIVPMEMIVGYVCSLVRGTIGIGGSMSRLPRSGSERFTVVSRCTQINTLYDHLDISTFMIPCFHGSGRGPDLGRRNAWNPVTVSRPASCVSG